jgi:hypothetical protein
VQNELLDQVMNNKRSGLETAVTQSTAAVVELLTSLGKPSNPLPAIVPLASGSQLVKSSKGDCYYVTSPESCTCPGFHYRHTCKHIKAMQSIKPHRLNMVDVLREHDKKLPRMPASYQRMARAAREDAESDLELKPKGSFKPFLE